MARWKADLLKYTKLSPEDVDARVRDACRVLPVRVRDACCAVLWSDTMEHRISECLYVTARSLPSPWKDGDSG